MLIVNRKGFKLDMPISDREIWGIGLVTYQWSLLEHNIDTWTSVALGKAMAQEPGRRVAFKDRARTFRETVEANAVVPWRDKLVALVNRTTGMQAERDKVVHWLWSEDDKQRIGIAEWRNGRNDTWKVNYGTLRGIALKIDAINSDFAQIVFETGHRPAAEGFLLSIAWQRICGCQNPTE